MHKMCEQILALILSTAMAVSIIPMHNVRAAEQTKEEASASDEMQYERMILLHRNNLQTSHQNVLLILGQKISMLASRQILILQEQKSTAFQYLMVFLTVWDIQFLGLTARETGMSWGCFAMWSEKVSFKI